MLPTPWPLFSQKHPSFQRLKVLRHLVAFHRRLPFPSLFINWEIHVLIPRHTAGTSPVAHDRRALAAGEARLFRVERPCFQEISRKIGVRDSLAAKPGELTPTLLDTAGSHIRRKLAQPA